MLNVIHQKALATFALQGNEKFQYRYKRDCSVLLTCYYPAFMQLKNNALFWVTRPFGELHGYLALCINFVIVVEYCLILTESHEFSKGAELRLSFAMLNFWNSQYFLIRMKFQIHIL
jgi:hypothetical protein